MDQNTSPTSGKPDRQLITVYTAIVMVIIAGLTVLFGPGLLTKARPPTFEVSAINTLGGENTYEITDHLIEAEPTDGVTLTWGVEVIPHYSGSKQYGEIRVLVKNASREVVAEGKWPNFSKDSEALFVELDVLKLASQVGKIGRYGGFTDNVFGTGTFTAPESVLDVQVVRASDLDHPLDQDKLVVRNSPWYHYTAMSAWQRNSIDVFVHGKNLGGQSDFVIVTGVFEVTDVLRIESDMWPLVDADNTLIRAVSPAESFTATVTFPTSPAFTFRKDKLYCIITYLFKKQNYVEFSDGPWDSTRYRSWLSGFVTQHLIDPSEATASKALSVPIVPYRQKKGLLMAHLDEPEGETSFKDASGYGNHGECREASYCPCAGVTGKVNTALRFDGEDDFVSLGNPASLNFEGNITIEAWVSPEATNGFRNIVAHGYARTPDREVFLRVAYGEYEIASWDGVRHGTTYRIPEEDVNGWVHIVGVHDSGVWRLYRNGIEVSSKLHDIGAVQVNSDWAIGATGSGKERFFQGVIDEVAIYDRALSAQEILDHYHWGLPD